MPEKCLAAMIALKPLPGAPRYDGNDRDIIHRALSDLRTYARAGVDAILVENSHDLPYIKPPLPREATRLLAQICRELRAGFAGPMGIQLLEAANETAFEIAAAAKFDFLRAEGYVFAHVGGAGIIEGCAGKLLRLRQKLGATHIKVFADLKKKHCSHALTGDLSIVDELKQAEFFLVDGVIVTGARTTEPPAISILKQVKKAARVPVWIGSGMTAKNVSRFAPAADGFIVGSTFREGGDFLGKLDAGRLGSFMDAFNRERL
jgi:membrane complex biogenesis BtpA family protein